MRNVVVSVFLILALFQAPAVAQMQGAQLSPARGTDRLDELFAELKRESNHAAARRIADRIREEWQRSGGATADLLIEWAQKAASEEKYHVSLDFLDQVVTRYPDYVEGWNSRALVYLMMNDFNRAMSDLSHTLSIEPRHFGAMGGLAGILRATGRQEGALEVYRRMLEVYPMQRKAQRAVLTITEQQTGQRL